MSEDNVTIVRRMMEAMSRNDPDGAFAEMDEDIVWHPPKDEPDSGTVHGHEGVQGLFLQWAVAFDDFRIEPLEFTDAGDSVLATLHISGRMRGSGAEVALEETHVHRLREGKIVEVTGYRTKAEALAAVGLQ